MAMQDYLEINGIDVTSYRITWDHYTEWDNAVDVLNISLSPQVKNIITLSTGLIVYLTRGFTTASDEAVFYGQITQFQDNFGKINLVCKGEMQNAIHSRRVKSWDKDIDIAAGVGSEIFKDLCTHSSLSYTSSSIITTGSGSGDIIDKFVQNNEDDFQKMNELAKSYNYAITYDPGTRIVEFKPKGYDVYGKTLIVGTDIPGQLTWNENMEQLCNKVTINGATVYDSIFETLTGPATSFTLQKQPEDTEVRQTSSTGSLFERVPLNTTLTSSTYYINVENKTITFNSAKSNIWIKYGAQVAAPVTISDPISIAEYGGPNLVPKTKILDLNDVKTKADAEKRGRAFIDKFSDPFIEIKDVPVADSVIQVYGTIKPGHQITIQDNFNSKNETVYVKAVYKKFPHTYDRLDIGDEIFRQEDFLATQVKKINQVYNELNKNQGTLTTIFDLNHDILFERRYMALSKLDTSTGTGFFLDTDRGILDMSPLDFSTTEVDTIVKLSQGDNTYKELLYDNTFLSTTGTGTTVDTTNKRLIVAAGAVFTSDSISLGTTFKYFTFNTGTGIQSNTTFYITADNSNWQTITGTGVKTSFTNSGDNVKYRVFVNTTGTGQIINNRYTINNEISVPAIYIKLEE